jgi:hypothetical protein
LLPAIFFEIYKIITMQKAVARRCRLANEETMNSRGACLLQDKKPPGKIVRDG